jgi:hypothetical protein
MTGPSVYTKAINEVHMEFFNNKINHVEINKFTDVEYKSDTISYRLYGIDYNSYFCFKHGLTGMLYNGKKHWRQEEREKPLLI